MSTAAVPEFLDLCFRADLGLLFGRWLHAPADEAEVRQGYEAALAVAARHDARYWLLDLRRRGPISTESTSWVIDTFLPRLAECLQCRPCLAYLLSPSHLTAYTPRPEAAAPAPCEVALFSDEHAALHWLEQCRHPETALAS